MILLIWAVVKAEKDAEKERIKQEASKEEPASLPKSFIVTYDEIKRMQCPHRWGKWRRPTPYNQLRSKNYMIWGDTTSTLVKQRYCTLGCGEEQVEITE